MHKLTTKMIAVVILLSTAVSSLASETTTVTRSLPLSANPVPLTAPTVVSKKALNSAELAKYQQLAAQSQGLASTQVAGASGTGKTVLITVGVVVAVVAVAALIATNGGDHVPFTLK